MILHTVALSKLFNILLDILIIRKDFWRNKMMNFDLSIDRESPFQPGKPVSPYFFKGRHASIQKILRYYNNACNCDVQHFFLTGK